MKLGFNRSCSVLILHEPEQKDSAESEDGEAEAKLDEATSVRGNKAKLVKMSETSQEKNINLERDYPTL